MEKEEQKIIINLVEDMVKRLEDAVKDKFEADPVEDYDDSTEAI